MKTHFATPERSTKGSIQSVNFQLSDYINSCGIAGAIPNQLLIVNEHRQIVYANNAMLEYLKIENIENLLGLRPGEIVNCVHADSMEAGCGTSKNCLVCGGVKAMLIGKAGKVADEEWRILTKSNLALEYKVHAVPFDFNGERFIILSITDISEIKKKAMLERIFFHDILNTAGGIQGFAGLLVNASAEESPEYAGILYQLTGRLIEEIQSQRDLVSAEEGDLRVQLKVISLRTFIESVIMLYQRHTVADKKHVSFESLQGVDIIRSDERLLGRVLGNLLKNAFEATAEGGEVRVEAKRYLNHYIISVHSSKYIEYKVQLQIFTRSFSTKGANRGLGTYSVKLLTEKYLKGRAGFFSSMERGTTFYVILPEGLPA